MDDETKRDLGAALLGAVLLFVGLLIRAGEDPGADNFGAILRLAGAVVLIVSVAKVGVRLARS